ncbi:MAG: DUF2188 domain-containing protein [Nitrospira sp.]|jgi:hypothetical protein|nr:DUF2188 domain-containing protein [Nitrospira sp.]
MTCKAGQAKKTFCLSEFASLAALYCRESGETNLRTGRSIVGRKTYHVTPASNGDWKVTGVGNSRASGVHANKADAVAQAKELAKSQDLGQVVIHSRDGKIQTEHTYGSDPHPPKG